MAKYKAYPEYKTTGLGWLTEIPDHWEAKKLKYLGQAIIGLTYSPDDVVDEGEGTLVLRSSNVQNGKLEFLDNVYVRKAIPLHLKVKKGDILICARNGSRALIGKNAKITKDAEGMTFGAFMSIFRSRYNNYLSHVFASALFEYQSSSFLTATINQLTTSNLNSFEIPLPPQTEQDRIVNFLDHETAKIDNLIEKQQQLIELLKEKRQAVISHAVTKGLNPDVPMKDSGVEWLGDVPKHWELVPLKYLCNFSGGGTPTKDNLSYWQGGTVPWVSPKDMKSFWISETEDYVTPKAVSESSTNYVEEGSLLMVVRSGILQRNIPVAINIVKVTMNQDMKALKFNERMKAHYAAYFINGNVNSLLLEWTKEGATVESIEHDYLANGLIPVPPIDEQHLIIKSISDQMMRFELLEEKALTGIRLLQERRTALISAAVTGKIDVRDWVALETQDIEESQEATA
ncbi:restriction endonuclease subunit S [Cronobacter turicensis]|uniref:restriction endonuclease subunit S n=1 Tax=Cronobacter turicensis TaxID=413502 RepID=UPI001DD73BBF|nr:restriction endonuclease subunit S [Cronobacter turicensis]EGT5682588.1 restriction endonuclease subunit S [Cronobacter turicensis]EGT5741760.1 restriction endonuclease subunit S [Cronobacter turicensis]ELY6319710.1 restriction endonuclease subunit S [Cronobacter turicensis]ELY7487694.1 restriction endonuclease subunit S [Cronobacter turicensis]MDI6433026.1 restriction endonuclease subunit S [Cronobacter turicensis]